MNRMNLDMVIGCRNQKTCFVVPWAYSAYEAVRVFHQALVMRIMY